jgi:hypothetical protein
VPRLTPGVPGPRALAQYGATRGMVKGMESRPDRDPLDSTDKRPLIWALVAISLLVVVGIAGDAAGLWDINDTLFGV